LDFATTRSQQGGGARLEFSEYLLEARNPRDQVRVVASLKNQLPMWCGKERGVSEIACIPVPKTEIYTVHSLVVLAQNRCSWRSRGQFGETIVIDSAWQRPHTKGEPEESEQHPAHADSELHAKHESASRVTLANLNLPGGHTVPCEACAACAAAILFCISMATLWSCILLICMVS